MNFKIKRDYHALQGIFKKKKSMRGKASTQSFDILSQGIIIDFY